MFDIRAPVFQTGTRSHASVKELVSARTKMRADFGKDLVREVNRGETLAMSFPFSPRGGKGKGLLPLAHHLCEAFKQVKGILRAGAGFRMVLHRDDRLAGDAEAAVGAVEQ